MKGVPIRLEIGPRDIENKQVIAARRDNGEKVALPMDNLNESIASLDEIQQNLFNKALKMRRKNLHRNKYGGLLSHHQRNPWIH